MMPQSLFYECVSLDTAAEWLENPNEILHPWEILRLNSFVSLRRRTTFLAGRIAAKRLLSKIINATPARQIAILTWNRCARGCKPQVWIARQRMPISLSISHDDGLAVAVIAESEGAVIGIDVVAADLRMSANSPVFSDFERRWLVDHHFPAARLFAAKEAAFKASNERRFFPFQFTIENDKRDVGGKVHVRFVDLKDRSFATRSMCSEQSRVLAIACRSIDGLRTQSKYNLQLH